MKSRSNAVSWVVILMAATSLVTMICLWQIDKIIHQDLYSYGLTFNLDWAQPYWTFARLGFAMGWINIIAAIAVQLYTMAFRQKEVEDLVTDVNKEIHKQWTIPNEKTENQPTPKPQPSQTTKQPQKTETPPQPQEKIEENPILAGVTQEEIPPPPEKKPQQAAPPAA